MSNRPAVLLFLLLGFYLITSSRAASALIIEAPPDWSWQFDSPTNVPIDTYGNIPVTISITNNADSGQNLDIGSMQLEPPVSVYSGIKYGDTSQTMVQFDNQLANLNLAPGQSITLTGATLLAPQSSPVPLGIYQFSGMTLTSGGASPVTLGPSNIFTWTVSPFSAPPIPDNTLTIPINELPVPSSSLADSTSPTLASEINADINPASPVNQFINYMDTSIASIKYSGALKLDATVAGNTMGIAGRGVSLAGGIATKSILDLAASAAGNISQNPNVNMVLGSAVTVSKLVSLLAPEGTAEAAAANPTADLILADTVIYGDLVAPQLITLGKDPADPNYSSFYQAPYSHLDLTLPSTGNLVLDANFQSLLQSSYQLAEDLNGLHISFDRYSTAYANGDNQACVLQLEAILYYVNQYKKDATTNSGLLNTIIQTLGPNFSFNSPLSADTLSSMQQEIEQNGFDANTTTFFQLLGLSSTQIAEIQSNILSLTSNSIPTSSTTTMLSSIQSTIAATATTPNTVPEPASFSLLLLGLVILRLTSSSKRWSAMKT